MRLLVSIALLSAFTALEAANISRAHRLCDKFFTHRACDSATLESILAEEAAKIGRSTRDHAESCAGIIDLEGFATRAEQGLIDKEWRLLDIFKQDFTSSDELRDYLFAHLPTTMELKEQFFDNARKKGSSLSLFFTESILRELLDAFAVLSNYDPAMRQQTVEYAVFRIVKKKFAEYKGLPEDAKKDLEQTFCLHTIYRVFEEIGQMERHITAVEAAARRNHVTYPLNATRALKLCKYAFLRCNSLTLLLIQEARSIAVAPQAHIDTCTATLDLQALVTRHQIESIEKELDSPELRAARFENITELEAYLARLAPTFVAFLERVDAHSRRTFAASKAGGAADEFLRQFVHGLYEVVVESSKVADASLRRDDGSLRLTKHLLKQADNYAALHDDAKIDLQRWLCVVTIARAAEDSGMVAELRNDLKRLGRPKDAKRN